MHTESGRVLLGRARVASLWPLQDARSDASVRYTDTVPCLASVGSALGICAMKLLTCGRDIFLSRTDHVAEVRIRTAPRRTERHGNIQSRVVVVLRFLRLLLCRACVRTTMIDDKVWRCICSLVWFSFRRLHLRFQSGRLREGSAMGFHDPCRSVPSLISDRSFSLSGVRTFALVVRVSPPRMLDIRAGQGRGYWKGTKDRR